jgi:hypothetical protein
MPSCLHTDSFMITWFWNHCCRCWITCKNLFYDQKWQAFVESTPQQCLYRQQIELNDGTMKNSLSIQDKVDEDDSLCLPCFYFFLSHFLFLSLSLSFFFSLYLPISLFLSLLHLSLFSLSIFLSLLHLSLFSLSLFRSLFFFFLSFSFSLFRSLFIFLSFYLSLSFSLLPCFTLSISIYFYLSSSTFNVQGQNDRTNWANNRERFPVVRHARNIHDIFWKPHSYLVSGSRGLVCVHMYFDRCIH